MIGLEGLGGSVFARSGMLGDDLDRLKKEVLEVPELKIEDMVIVPSLSTHK